MKHFLKSLLYIVLAIVIIRLPTIAYASSEDSNNKTIRVAFPIQEGFSKVDEQGILSGYTYDYLMRVAQRTGWKYEFVIYDGEIPSLVEALELLESGEIDLIGAMNYNEQLARMYEYCAQPYGDSYFTLVAHITNTELTERTYLNIPNPKIAIVKSASTQNQILENFCAVNMIEPEYIYAENNNACDELLRNGEVDLIISKDVIKNEELKTIARMSPQPFYFAATKGKVDIIKSLNQAITDLNNIDPFFPIKLYEKHFEQNVDEQINFTPKERAFIATSPSFKVAVITDRAPIQYIDKETGEYKGIVIDVLALISQKTGLRFHYTEVKDTAQGKELLASGQVDIIAGIPYSYDLAEELDVLLTSSVLSSPIVRIVNNTTIPKNTQTLLSSSVEIDKAQKDTSHIMISNSIELLELIDSGEYGMAYGDGYMAQYYIEKQGLINTSIHPSIYDTYNLCLGVNRNKPLELVGILEHSISKLTTKEIEDIIFENTLYPREVTLNVWIKKNTLLFSMFVLCLSGSIIIIMAFFLMRTTKMKKLILAEQKKFLRISKMDQLTQIYNSETFKEAVRDILENADGKILGTLIICDIDHFKEINDKYGHMEGDKVLQHMGSILREIFSPTHIVGRIGGDEFMVYIKEVGSQEQIADYCQLLLSKCKELSSSYPVTLSIGAAVCYEDTSFEESYAQADKAMYEIKNNGKNGFEIIT